MGSWVKFNLPIGSNGEWVANPKVARIRLRRIADGYEVQDVKRRILRFANQFGERWLLSAIEDPNGYWIHFTYNDRGALRWVEHSGGYRLAVEGTESQIRRVLLVQAANPSKWCDTNTTSPAGWRPVRLTAAVCRSGIVMIPTAEWRNGEDRRETWYEYQYDERGRCRSAFSPEGLYHYRFEYDDANRSTRVTNSLGDVSIVVSNQRQQPVLQRDARGGETRTEWDEQSNKLSERDPEGRGFTREYDADGNSIRRARSAWPGYSNSVQQLGLAGTFDGCQRPGLGPSIR